MRLFAAFVGVALAVGCQTANAGPASIATTNASWRTSVTGATAMTRLHVEGIACERCSSRLTEGLKKVDGVLNLSIDREHKEVLSPTIQLG